MRPLPTEIWTTILVQLSLIYPVPSSFGRKRGREGFAAFAATCRYFSKLARPYVLETVLLDRATRAQELLELIHANSMISRRIKEVCIWPHSLTEDSLLDWLGMAEGLTLMSQLTRVRTLRVRNVTNFHNCEVVESISLPHVWETLSALRSATVVDVHDSGMPMECVVLRLFTAAYPNLQELTVSRVNIAAYSVPCHPTHRFKYEGTGAQPPLPAQITSLTLRIGLLDSVVPLIRKLDLTRLTHFKVGPDTSRTVFTHEFAHLRELLPRIVQLQSLTISRCADLLNHSGINYDPADFNLAGASPKLHRIAFREVGPRLDLAWFADVIRTLPRITQLRSLTIAGDIEKMLLDASALAPLDKLLSDTRFLSSPVPEGRQLRLEHTQSESVPDQSHSDEKTHCISNDLLARIRTLGTFTIEWPIQSTMQAGTDTIDTPVQSS